MTKPLLTVAAVIVTGLAACAPARQQSPGPKTDLLEIQNRLSEAEGKIDQLTQRVTLMQIIIDSHQRTLQDPAVDTAAGDVDVGMDPSRTPPETEASQALSQTSPPISETVPETASSGSSPEPREDESVQRPETEEELTNLQPGPRYQAAMEVLRGGDYETAGGLFEEFARQFPENDLADNALYWSGECRYTQKDYTGALKQFRQVIEDHPSGSKVPDALLKIGFTHLSLGDRESAITYLKKVVAQYPFSAAGEKAEERLKEIQE